MIGARRTTLAAAGFVLAVAGGAVAASGGGASRSAAPPVDGRSLFVAKGCAMCHTGPDSESPVGAGPSLVDASTWAGTRRPGLDAAAYLAESIAQPGAFLSPARPGQWSMPALSVTSEEIDELVDYLLDR